MAFPTKSHSLYSVLNLLGILHLLFFFPSNGTPSGHTTHLIPRDSPLSPFYDPSSTHFDRLHNAFQRSLKRINHFKSAIVPRKRTTQAPLNPSDGEYAMKIAIGTPPVEVIGIADTGSDLIWTQCLPCIQCYNQTIPIFNPKRSSTYHTIPCQSKFCNALDNPQCDHNTTTCEYRYSYEDGSHTAGNLASETLTLGSSNPISLPNTVFGCTHDTAGEFDGSESGIIGLGAGKLSLTSQLGTKKFSYCLIPSHINSTSWISFGNNSVVSGPNVVTTSMVRNYPINLYFLTLEAFSVGKHRIPFVNKGENKKDLNSIEGNIIIDSGTTFTLVPDNVYNGLVSGLDKVIKAKRVKDPNGLLTLCYEVVHGKISLPIITAHFKGGDVKLKPVNTFSWVKKHVLCFTMISYPDLNILGNLAQINFLVGYDLQAGTVSFKPTDCTKRS
ncbi:hypothetical protein VNO77_02590 [Canavalia gladiata]|uniref:Peptidase A1 domain-containing protein n=1 Tax=Canavalia gladiata TaxID=3824 RepID=A0AAN9MY93_CANGL